MNDENVIEFSVGKKADLFKFGPVGYDKGVQTRIIALSPFTFTIAIKADWKKAEIRGFKNQFSFYVAQINDVIDFVGEIDKCLSFDVAFYPNSKPFEKFEEFPEDKGMAFHMVMVDKDDVIIYQRLVSLNSDKSNDLVKVLNETAELNIPFEIYNQKIDSLYAQMTTREIEREAFIRQTFSKTRY